jgi:hypothetical protein
VQKVEEYRRFAREWAERARATASAAERELFQELSREWEALASARLEMLATKAIDPLPET